MAGLGLISPTFRDKGGFSQQQAEDFVDALAEVMPGDLLSKADLAAFESRLSGSSS